MRHARTPTARRWPWAAVALVAGAGLLVAQQVSAPSSPVAFSAPLTGDAVGNGTPAVVAYDGFLVRRCTAVVLWAADPAGAEQLRQALHVSAGAAGMDVLDLPVDVVGDTTLASGVPDVVACLPWGAGAADVSRAVPAPLVGQARSATEEVLVHDVTFAVRPSGTDADTAAATLDRDGVLADALGQYAVDTAGPDGELLVRYTGPLLSDVEVDATRETVGASAGTTGTAVQVRPASTEGPAVELAPQAEQELPSPTGTDEHGVH